MKRLDMDCLAAINFEIMWESREAKHREHSMTSVTHIGVTDVIQFTPCLPNPRNLAIRPQVVNSYK